MTRFAIGSSVAATKYPAATKNDHHDFCDHENWQVVRGAKGKPVRHHVTFTLTLSSGRVLRTRISRPVNNQPYSTQLFSLILRDQLEVTEPVFWGCVKDGILPDREPKQPEAPANALPLGLAMELKRLGVTDDVLATLTPQSAAGLLAELYSQE